MGWKGFVKKRKSGGEGPPESLVEHMQLIKVRLIKVRLGNFILNFTLPCESEK